MKIRFLIAMLICTPYGMGMAMPEAFTDSEKPVTNCSGQGAEQHRACVDSKGDTGYCQYISAIRGRRGMPMCRTPRMVMPS